MSFTKKPQTRGPSAPASQLQIPPPYSSDDRSLGGTVSASPRPPASPQQSPRPIEPAGAGPIGGASSALPRPPTTHQPSPRSAEPAGAGPAVRREVVRQKKMAVMEKADSVDEDEFDKLVAINYQQLVDVPPSPTGTATLSPPVSRDPQRSPKLSPRLARRPSPAEQSPPISAAPPSLRAPPLRQTHQKLQQKTAGNKQDLKTEEESEDELSKLSLADKLKLFSGKKLTGKSVDSSAKSRRHLPRFQTQPVTFEELEQAHDWSRDSTQRSYGPAHTQRPSGHQMTYRDY